MYGYLISSDTLYENMHIVTYGSAAASCHLERICFLNIMLAAPVLTATLSTSSDGLNVEALIQSALSGEFVGRAKQLPQLCVICLIVRRKPNMFLISRRLRLPKNKR